jgi:capsular polysaccharide biosynthesis protein
MPPASNLSSLLPLYGTGLKRALPMLVLVSLLAGVIALAIVRRFEPAAQVHFSYLVSLSQREDVPEFRFDGYYALQATDLFAETLAAWVQTPEVIAAAYQEAGLKLPTNDPRAIVRSVVAEKSAAQLVQVTVRHTDPATARKLTTGLQTVMQQNIERYDAQGIPALQFRAVPTTPLVGQRQVATRIIVTATMMGAFFLGLNLRLLQLSFQQWPHEESGL